MSLTVISYHTFTGYVHKCIQARNERYLCGPSVAIELSIETYAFTIDLIDFVGGIRKIPRGKVSADTGLIACFRLGFLTSEGVVNEFYDIAL